MELDLRRLRPVLFLIASHGWTSALAQHTYTGAQMDNLWCTPSNWNPMSVPSGDAVIPGSISQRVRMAGNCTPTFQSLTAIGPVDFNGEVRYSGSVIAADIIIRSGSFTIGPTMAGGATLSLTDSAEWGSGILARQFITVEAAALLRIPVGGGHNLLRASLNNQGAVRQSAPVSIIGDLTQGITNDGLWTLAAPGVLLRTVSITDTAEFANNGILATDFTSAGPATISLPVINRGEIRAAVGDLDFSRTTHPTVLSRLSASPGRRITLAATTSVVGGTQASGDGTVAVTSGLISISSGEFLTALDVSGSFGGGFLLNTSEGMLLDIGSSLRNAGTFTWQRGPILADTNSTPAIVNNGRLILRASSGTLVRAGIDNQATLVVDLPGSQVLLKDAAITSGVLSSIEWRAGTLRRDPTSTTGVDTGISLSGTLSKVTAAPAAIATDLRARGLSRVAVQEGELRLSTPPGAPAHQLMGGFVDISSNATLLLDGDLTARLASIEGTGVFRVGGGAGIFRIPADTRVTTNMQVSSDGFHVDSGQVLGAGEFENLGTMVLSNATLGDPGLDVPMLVTNRGFLHARNGNQTVRAFIDNFALMAIDTPISLAPRASLTNSGELSIGNALTIGAQPGTPAGAVVNGAGATIRKRNLDPATITAPLTNVGTVIVQQGRLQISGPIEQLVTNAQGERTLFGGTWIVQPQASLSFGNRSFRTTAGNTRIVADGTFDDFEPTRFRDQSITELGTLLDPSEDMIASENARITLNFGGEIGNAPGCPVGDCTRLTLSGSSWLTGNGLIDRQCILTELARLSPGASPGTLTFRSLWMQGGVLAIELGGLAPGTEHDQIVVQNNATLGGTLLVRVLPGFTPQTGQRFDILTASAVLGTFARLEAEGLRSDQRPSIAVLGDRVRLSIASACPADVDDGSGTGTPDGGVTIDDLLYYLSQYAQGSTVADLDDGSGNGTPDGGVTIDDLLYYLLRFEHGC